MDQWEHMLVTAVTQATPQFIAFPVADVPSARQQPSAGTTVALLNELGEQGWQLVSATPGDGFRTGTYWLKRPAPTSDGGWGTSV